MDLISVTAAGSVRFFQGRLDRSDSIELSMRRVPLPSARGTLYDLLVVLHGQTGHTIICELLLDRSPCCGAQTATQFTILDQPPELSYE